MSQEIESCATLLQQRFGPDVLCDAVALDGEAEPLWPAERAAVAQAVPRRQREFAAGRACARRLLERLGLPPAAVPANADRSPIWPAGAIGSIAHDASICVVAVAKAGPLLSLGVDVEPDAPLEDELWPTVCSPRELAALLRRPGPERGAAARLVFSAKESVYKCLHPLLRIPLRFHDVELELASDGGFRARLCGRAPPWRGAPLDGFHARSSGWLLTGMRLPPAAETST